MFFIHYNSKDYSENMVYFNGYKWLKSHYYQVSTHCYLAYAHTDAYKDAIAAPGSSPV